MICLPVPKSPKYPLGQGLYLLFVVVVASVDTVDSRSVKSVYVAVDTVDSRSVKSVYVACLTAR